MSVWNAVLIDKVNRILKWLVLAMTWLVCLRVEPFASDPLETSYPTHFHRPSVSNPLYDLWINQALTDGFLMHFRHVSKEQCTFSDFSELPLKSLNLLFLNFNIFLVIPIVLEILYLLLDLHKMRSIGKKEVFFLLLEGFLKASIHVPDHFIKLVLYIFDLLFVIDLKYPFHLPFMLIIIVYNKWWRNLLFGFVYGQTRWLM